MYLSELNQLPDKQAELAFSQCCTSMQWIKKMIAAKPFKNHKQLGEVANTIWSTLSENDYLQAFNGHPKIGDVNSLKEKFANTKALASGEQSSVSEATKSLLSKLAEANKIYLDKFGFIFIVCATGKSAEEMLELLQQRLVNDRQTELKNAAEEQRKIFQIRLNKLLETTK